MKGNLKLSTLASRRAMLQLSPFRKLYHPYLHELVTFPPHYILRKLDRAHKVGIPVCKTVVTRVLHTMHMK